MNNEVKKPKVVIVGGGFGGLSAAQKLGGKPVKQRNVKTDTPIEDSRGIYAKARKFIVYDTFSL